MKNDTRAIESDTKIRLIMKLILPLLIGTILLGCSSSEYSKIELISTSGRALDYYHSDSLIFGLYIHVYAQIDKDGNCLTVRRITQDCTKFDSFKIDSKMIKLINQRLSKIKSDTFLTVKSDREIYDGSTIQLFVHQDNKSIRKLTFLNSKNADNDFLRLYNYIDSTSLKNKARLFDTTRLKSDRDKLISLIEQNILKSGNTFNRDTIVIIK